MTLLLLILFGCWVMYMNIKYSGGDNRGKWFDNGCPKRDDEW